MRPEHYRLVVYSAGADADDVANGVDCDGERQLAHPLNKEIAPSAILITECEATITAARQRTDPIESREAPEKPIAVDLRPSRHQCRHLMGAGR
jgi:hypothetical protein